MLVACLQLSSNDEISTNLACVEALLDSAAAAGVRLAVLPENFSYMADGHDSKVRFAGESSVQLVFPFLADQAKKHNQLIVAGSLLLAGEKGMLRNACPVFAPDGTCLACYDKIHLFDIELEDECYEESAFVQAGTSPVQVDFFDWRLGLSVCYDLRFPELYRRYAALGCNLLPIPAAFTLPTGRAHWESLLRARAIENQAYVLAAAQVGTHPGGRKTYGHSMIIDPWGEIVAQAENSGGAAGELVVAEIELRRLAEVRRQIPALEHRRL